MEGLLRKQRLRDGNAGLHGEDHRLEMSKNHCEKAATSLPDRDRAEFIRTGFSMPPCGNTNGFRHMYLGPGQ